MWSPRYLAYCRVHRVTPGSEQQAVDHARFGHRNYGVLRWDGFNKLSNRWRNGRFLGASRPSYLANFQNETY